MALKCPACADATLWSQRDPDTRLEIDICPVCHGMWFDARELAVFLQSPTLKNRFMWKPDSRHSQAERDQINAGSRQCPRCEVLLAPMSYANVTLDTCPRCEGIWFDDGEVRMIVERYKKGARSGDDGLVGEIRTGLSVSGDEKAGGVFGSLRSFLKSARSSD